MRLTPHLLWIDSGAGLIAGIFVVLFSTWLGELYGLPRSMILFAGAANLVFGCFSGMLARQRRRPPALLVLLVVGNATWALLCGVAAVMLADRLSGYGLAHLLGEGIFVGGLAALEWRARHHLQRRTA